MTITISLDGMKLRSLNSQLRGWNKGHLMAQVRKTKAEREMARLTMIGQRDRIEPAYIITLTRVAPRKLDDDNLRGALKAVRDGVADALRVEDNTPLIHWEYKQEQAKEYAVLVEVRWEDAT